MSSFDPSSKPVVVTRPPKSGTEQNGHSSQAALSAVLPPLGTEDDPRTPRGLSSAPSVSALMHALRRRWSTALLLAVLGATATVGVVCMLFPAKYVAQARLRVASRHASQPEVEPAIWRANQEAILRSPRVLDRALTSKRVQDLGNPSLSVEGLEKSLKVDFLLGPEILRVTLTGNNADEAAILLNAVVDSYLQELDLEENLRRKSKLKQLEDSKKRTSEDLYKLRTKLAEMEKFYKVDDKQTAEFKYKVAMDKLNAMEKEYRDCKSDLGKKQRELDTLKVLDQNLDKEPVARSRVDKRLRESPVVQEHLRTLAEVEKRISDINRTTLPPRRDQFLKEAYADRAALVKAFEALAGQIRPEIEEELRQDDRETLRAEMGRLDGQIGSLKSQETGLNDAVHKLEEEVKRLDPVNRPRIQVVEQKRDEVRQLEEAQNQLNVEIARITVDTEPGSRGVRLQTAEPPASRDFSRQLKIGGAAGLGVFLVMLLGVALIEFRLRKVNGPDDVARGLGMTVLGTLPAVPSRARKSVAATEQGEQASWQVLLQESVDAVRTFLLHTAKGDGLQVVMVSSAGAGEGKTSLASQLATSLARAWRKTLLVDGDLRHPSAHTLFQIPLEPGFSEVLRSEVNLLDAIRSTALSRLWLMPAGQWDAHAGQALAQERVQLLFEQMKDQYDFIIVDSSPIFPVADALLLSEHVDGVVFSVLRDVTRLPALHAAHERLQALGVRTIGAVVAGTEDANTKPAPAA